MGELKAKEISIIDDTVSGFVLAINNNKSIGEIINIGSELGISIQDLVLIISKILKKKLSIKIDKSKIRPSKSEIFRLVADTSKAKKLLNWESKMKNNDYFLKSIIKTIEWYKKNGIFRK